jgi:hypothetical protein
VKIGVQATAGAQCRQGTDGVKEGAVWPRAQMLAMVFESLRTRFGIVRLADSQIPAAYPI